MEGLIYGPQVMVSQYTCRPITVTVRAPVFWCEYCQNANATQGDHAKTLNSFKNDVNGGKMTASEAKTVANSKDNIVASCKQCNQVDKHTKDLGTGPNQYNPPNPNMRVQTMLKGN